MNDQSIFSRKKIQTINIEKRDWMEELNFPPKLIKFLRENARLLQVIGVLLVLCILGYNGGKLYFGHRLETSTAKLDRAMNIVDPDKRQAALTEVATQYGRTDAGLWARVQLAQMAYGKKDFDTAIGYYQKAIGQTDSDSSLMPLLQYGLANAYEQKKDFAAAAEHFNKLREFKGFERQAWLGLGRISEKENHPTAAINAYEKVLAIDEEAKNANNNNWLQEKVRSLKAAAAATANSEDTTAETK